MSNEVIVFKGRTNTIPCYLGFDITGDTISSEIRSDPTSDSDLIATWEVTVEDAATGQLSLKLDNSALSSVTAKTGYMDLKRVSGGEPLPVFDKTLKVEFRDTVTA